MLYTGNKMGIDTTSPPDASDLTLSTLHKELPEFIFLISKRKIICKN